MKVVLVNTTDSGGGAAIACKRLMEALTLEGVDVRMLVMNKKSRLVQVQPFRSTQAQRKLSFFRFIYERLSFLFHEKDKTVRFAFSLANIGVDISNHSWIKEADIVHIHWINGGFLSLKNMNQILTKKKNVLWTLHDMWLFTGGCHYAGACKNFKKMCGNCPMLKKPSDNDLSNRIWNKKWDIFSRNNLNIVTCSRWLSAEASSSQLLKNANISSIPNPISLTQFKPEDKKFIRKKWNITNEPFLLLFGAANVQDKRKGFSYLIDALRLLIEMGVEKNQLNIVVFGKAKNFDASILPYPVHHLGVIKSTEKMTDIYAMADLFVLPSIEDNLPNTVMESMACATPVIGFNIGGIPEMVDSYENGIIVDEISAESLAKGILFCIQNPELPEWGFKARQKVEQEYNNQKIAQKYVQTYTEIIDKNRNDYAK